MIRAQRLSLLLVFPLVLFAADLGRIQGRVFDKDAGEALPSVNIMIEGTKIGAATDMNGDFIIPNVRPGTHKLIASMLGYKTVAKRVTVDPGKTVMVEFNLRPTILKVEPIVVTATRAPRYIKDVPVRTEVITSQAIKDKGAGTLYEALNGSPGIRVEEQCQFCNFSMVRMQGLGPDHTQVLIDGQPVYSGLASVYGLQQLGTANIDRIEVVKGAGSALYGAGAVAGGINIITKKPSHNSNAKVGVEFGSYNTNRYDFFASTRKNNIGVSLFAQKHGGDAIDETRDGESSGVVRKPDGISDRVKTDAVDAGFSVVADSIFGNDQVIATGKALHELRQGGLLDDDTYENPFTEGTERIITNRYETELKYRKGFRYGNEINLTFAYAYHHRNATNDGFLGDYMATHNDSLPPLNEMRPYLAEEKLYAANLNYLHPIFGKHRLLAGLQYSYNRLKESGKYVIVDEEDSLYGTSYTSTSKKHADEIGVYLQDEISISDVIEIVAGVRYDYHESEDEFRGSGKVAPEGVLPVEYDETALNPRFAIKLSPHPSLTLRSSVGTGFRVPYGFSEDLHLCSGSPRVWKGADLKPEKSISFNFSADFDVADRFTLAFNLFRTNLKNKIGFVEASERAKSLGYTYEWENIDNAYVQGVEVASRFEILNRLILSADLTVNDGQYEHEREDWKGTPYEEDSKYISRFPLYTGGAKVEFIPEDWNFVVEGDYYGPMYIDYFQDEEEPTKIKKTEPYLILSAKASRRFFDRFAVFVGGKNLTDYIQPEKHTDDAAFMYAPVYGRIVYGGIEIEL